MAHDAHAHAHAPALAPAHAVDVHDLDTARSIIAAFAAACAPVLAHADFRARRRAIKDLFVRRHYAAIFADPRLLNVYVAEYSPSRALAYHALFARTPALAEALRSASSVLCIGAGPAAEVVAILAALPPRLCAPPAPLTIRVHDIADYSPAVAPLLDAVRNTFNTPPDVSVSTAVFDILSSLPEHVEETRQCIAAADVITAFFLLNELLASSKKQFVGFVKILVNEMKPGALLVVADSAGSFSEVNVDRNQKGSSNTDAKSTYMVYNLLDAIQAFEVVEKTDSRWYRFPDGLHYPVKLNNMRYFLRIYRKKKLEN
ncbi:hypothetical protein HDU83_001991 [Entophlyctis luteolus]|nr:hypothetical protein HDU83_001991 [Entophlyctis luteolus]